MSDLERLYKIKYMIQARHCVPIDAFLEELEISKATFKRDLEYLRDRLNASIVYDRAEGGYRFDKPNVGDKVELPGLWFSEKEATALVLMQHLLSNLDQGGLIGPHIDPLIEIIDGILGRTEISAKELRKRIKVFGVSSRKSSLESFEEIGSALLKRQRLDLEFYSKAKDELTTREVSPQRLIFYRDNWYLDAYCHLRKELRSFSLDGIRKVLISNKKADEIPEKSLQEHFAESYGIFSGKATKRAKLIFTPERARWVSKETWHKQQVSSFDKDGNYILEFDYDQDPELVMEILRHGSSVEVISPASLRKKIKEELTVSLQKYK
ncbi:YafY family transcriptional regulator [Polynucleobacter sp. MWH-Mekk-B1]|uniref:helix-turn-helix transcriptional regulator n=1 Tax=Polynucleobacter finlandensis TaxID=1855894 RepID=UPI001C0BBDBB|nr:YafY family protein [Polynucleobacter finlandensis]MBU3545455.1 YafY family transcriptional regulator [Polynucleobacter finlandensis]